MSNCRVNKPFIVCGYPGVGKSSIAGWNDCIDLESSFFRKLDCENDSWIETYCTTAIDIASQGYYVLTSTHKEVIQFFHDNQILFHQKNISGPFIFCPQKSMKYEWILRLHDRFEKEQTTKNFRAYERAVAHFDEDIDYLTSFARNVYQPESMDYDLKTLIKTIHKRLMIGDDKV